LEREGSAPPEHRFLATGDPAQFQRVADVFLGPELGEVRAAQVRTAGGSP
jgi:glutamate racemase